MQNQVASQKKYLAVHHEWRARARQSDRRPKSIPIHHRVHQRHRQYRWDLKRLRELQPQVRHAQENRLVQHLEQRQPPPPEDREVGAEEVEEAGEVEDVGPEEDAAGGAGPEGKAEEPLEGGLRAAPEPPRVADLGCG